MARKQIRMSDNEPWLTLLHHIANSMAQVYLINCTDEREARETARLLRNAINTHTWFEALFVARRGDQVCVSKVQFAESVVLRR